MRGADTGVPIANYSSLIHTQTVTGMGKPFDMRWSWKSRGTFSPAAPVSAALPRTPAVEEMRTTDTHTVREDSTKASVPRRHNHHILAEDTVPSAPIGDAGRCS